MGPLLTIQKSDVTSDFSYAHNDEVRDYSLTIRSTRRQVRRMVATREEHDRARPADIREALRQGATRIWDVIETNADLLRVMFREPEAIEDFADELWTAVTFTAYERMGEALSGAKAAGSSQVEDPEAASAVILSALAYFPIVRILIGRTPGNIDADRFRDAWLRLAEGVFNGAPPT